MITIAANGMAWGQKAVRQADILQAPGWRTIYDSYVPDAELIRELRLAIPGRRAVVYFGSWCDDSKNHVPVILKIIDSLDAPGFQVDFMEVEKKPAHDQEYYVPDQLVEKIPTFIFFIGDSEIGRIIENPKESVLKDMLGILQ